jgi:hypothetical protein
MKDFGMQQVWEMLKWVEAGSLLVVMLLACFVFVMYLITLKKRRESYIDTQGAIRTFAGHLIHVSQWLNKGDEQQRAQGLLRYLADITKKASGNPKINADTVRGIINGKIKVELAPTPEDMNAIKLSVVGTVTKSD